MPALRDLASGGERPKVDIVAVHGLNPRGKSVKDHAWDTWRKPDGASGKLWMRDDLPTSLPDARILLYEYDSRVFSGTHALFRLYYDDGWQTNDTQDPLRPLILVAHSLGGLLVKQALVNAHDNRHYAYIEQSVKGLVFFGTPHEGGNLKDAKVKLGFTAASIAQSLGLEPNESIVQALRPGSLFSDFLKEAFRHQLENYNIVSFWEKEGTIVTKESATFGLPGHRENIIGLEAKHSSICRFDLDIEQDRDVYEFVKNNMYWVYEEALKEAALEQKLEALEKGTPALSHQKVLEIANQFDGDMSTWKDHLIEIFMDRSSENILDWMLSTSGYRNWSGARTDMTKQKPMIWCQIDNALPTAKALGQLLVRTENGSLIHITNDHPLLPELPLLKDMGCPEHAISLLFSLLQQAYALIHQPQCRYFPSFVVESGLFYQKQGWTKSMGMEVSRVFAELLKGDPQKDWTILIHDVDSLHEDAVPEVGRLLARILGGFSGYNVDRLRVVAIGRDPGKMPQVARHCTVINGDTEYLECLASLQFDNMTVRQDRIASATVGTNQWIWNNPSYLFWKGRPSSVIWICGKPGSGKSVLAKTMQTQFLAGSSSRQSMVLSWFYSIRDNLVLHREMFLAILSQLLSQNPTVYSCIKGMYRSLLISRADVSSTHWSITELQAAISTIFHGLKGRPVSALCIVDGLDESKVEYSENDCSRSDALKFLTHLTSNGMPLRITFLSRPSDDIKRALKNQPSIFMHDVNRPDIENLIDKGVKSLGLQLDGYDSDNESQRSGSPTSLRVPFPGHSRRDSIPDEYFNNADSEKREILSEIDLYLRMNANGVVLWVITVLEILRKRCQEVPFCDIRSLKKHLEGIPFEMKDLYSQITSDPSQPFRKSPDALNKARRVLMWVSVSSKYRMQLQDWREVISYDFENHETSEKPKFFAGITEWSSFRRQLERLCGPFVEIVPILPRGGHLQDQETTRWDTLQLAHETVRTFLQQDNSYPRLGFSAAEAERVVREERRIYMRRTLPPLTGLLVSGPAQHTDKDISMFCNYMESRPLLCFILQTLNFELQYFALQKDGKALLADAINQCDSITDRLHSQRQRSGLLHDSETTPVQTPEWSFPFLLAGSLLRVLGFLDFTDPVGGGSGPWSLYSLFSLTCSLGQLNAVNALSSLLVCPHRIQLFQILGAMRHAAEEAGLNYEHSVLGDALAFFNDIPAEFTCVLNASHNPVARSDRVHAAISQVFGHQIFSGGSAGFWSILAELKADSLLFESPLRYRSQPLNGDEYSIYQRTPFTKLISKSPNGSRKRWDDNRH
ncbi:hypothetical protein J7T55_000792 [Diaporthe amygdali]|uniref:uncharacterized protein n=1 Tax=Phomopsis amygdali TaxID=1214568 RepID=UPI0022FE2C3C|nr:uncharacterized protein J7T55_000792 [Diaporthe amygdali]KAJ0119942.1 hypothetical protein J7T55_000792 [Diaporthe amygdali]